MERKKDQEVAVKDAEIADLKASMDHMAAEFGNMLKQTLEKMNEKIVISNSARWNGREGEATQDSIPHVVQTFDKFSIGLTPTEATATNSSPPS